MLWLEINYCQYVYVRRYIDSTNLRSSALSHWSEGGTETGRRVARDSKPLGGDPRSSEREGEIQSRRSSRRTNIINLPYQYNYLGSPFVKSEPILKPDSVRVFIQHGGSGF